MLISIITVNYNDVRGLIKTLESVQCQDFDDYEHIVIDGGSTDGSKELLETSQGKFLNWVSEPDNGIYDAMNKGIERATGEYILFINSGDTLFNAGALSQVCKSLQTGTAIVYGNLRIVKEDGYSFTNTYPGCVDFSFFKRTSLGHGATFIKRSLFETYGNYRTDLKIVSDWAFFIKVLCEAKVSQAKVDMVISTFYEGGVSTTPENTELHKAERKQVLKEHFDLYDETFDNVLEKQMKIDSVWSQVNDKLNIVVTNAFFLKILNAVIAFLGWILERKRQWFN
ncbi:glycosyltransferase [Dokdonia sinensis]|uniref:Glycosyltransferase n=1 Tax=Dokdonia sinensis TaxID=2479847 RepID=A0A3M0FXK5_9FLAO|nr:glycosyltransferase family 2 protein [Dokdonia sinensis]RMB57431.1 glycosyltransferase [Dokdonia sinensis]